MVVFLKSLETFFNFFWYKDKNGTIQKRGMLDKAQRKCLNPVLSKSIIRFEISRSKKVKSAYKDPTRVIKLGSEPSSKYPSNRVVTSKYTVWNFLPKNLFEQFRRISNFYFLCMAIISVVIESPVSPMTTITPLVFVISVSAMKQGYEDYRKHKTDREVNECPVSVVRNGCVETIPSKNIRVGDLVRVECNQDIPCDLVLLLSSHSESKCFVTTANLDGETNLKTLHCPRSLKRTCKTEADLSTLEATIKCENPTHHLYKFHGRIEFGAKTSNVLRQSAILRHQFGPKPGESQTELEVNDVMVNSVASPVPTDAKIDAVDGMEGRHSTIHIPGGDDRGEREPEEGDGSIQGPQLRLKVRKTQAKRTESFPKSAVKTHKKTSSNVERVSFNLEATPTPTPIPNDTVWSYERKASLLSKKNSFLLTGSNRPSLTTSDGNVADSLSTENLLLKGSKLKSTDYVYGCAVYTGSDTKLALNSKLTHNKISTVEKSVNKYLLVYLSFLLVMIVVSTVLKVVKECKNGFEFRAPYINPKQDQYQVTFGSVVQDILSSVSLYSYVIPISLYVSLELQKFLGAFFFRWDLRLYDEETKEGARSNTSDLSEDLGQIEYLFTDKTGTLTKNEMQFAKCSVNDVIYEEKDGVLYPLFPDTEELDLESPVDLKNCSREMELFLCALSLCHTVQVSSGGEKYNATSPDEKALLEAMKKLDIVFADDDDEVIVIKILGQCKFFKKLDVLEFSSERKRMSVIIEDEEGNITLYCKGAETSVIPQVKQGPKDITLKHVAHFATQRLRTLVVGYRFLTKEQFERISDRIKRARETLSEEREAIVAATYGRIESNLTVLGATGIKDDIQDGVKDTLKSLKAGGIKIWMLTGDKPETAEYVSLECGHFEEHFGRLFLKQQSNPSSCEDTLLRHLRKLEEDDGKEYGLIIDGESLTTALTYHKDLLRSVSVKCEAVICSRMSPLQKKEIVQLIKDQKRSPVTAAIGDGANDVAMIQEAHVGIGIMGKEGRQAVHCSDFAFAKFKFLRRVLFVHGHWYYMRTANLVQYFFYKNLAFVLPQFYYIFFSGYSIQSLYDGLYLSCYNTFFTAVPILIYGLYEQNFSSRQLETSPSLYLIHRRNSLMSWYSFLQWFILGLWHSVVVFFLPALSYKLDFPLLSMGSQSFGTLVFHSSVTVVSLKLLLHSKYWSALLVASIFLSVALMVLVSVVYSFVLVENLTSNNFMVYINMLGSPTFWLLIILIIATSLIPDFTIYAIKNIKRHKLKLSHKV